MQNCNINLESKEMGLKRKLTFKYCEAILELIMFTIHQHIVGKHAQKTFCNPDLILRNLAFNSVSFVFLQQLKFRSNGALQRLKVFPFSSNPEILITFQIREGRRSLEEWDIYNKSQDKSSFWQILETLLTNSPWRHYNLTLYVDFLAKINDYFVIRTFWRHCA